MLQQQVRTQQTKMEPDTNKSISLVSHIHSVTSDFLVNELKKNGLPDFATSHGNILFQLSLADSLTMKELSERINRDKSTTTVLVRKLEQADLVITESDSKDKRSKTIKLTEKGKNYNAQINEISKKLISTFYQGFTEEEKSDFLHYLLKINQNFK